MPRGGVRLFYVATYAAFAALGAALLARPALEWLRGLGLFAPVLPSKAPLGWASAALLLVLVVGTVAMAVGFALGRRPGLPGHAAFLGLIACALALRAASEPSVPTDADPALRDALRAAASALDTSYVVDRRYDADVHALQAALDALPRPGFWFRGKPLGWTAREIQGATAPRREPLPGDLPATVYVAIAPGRQRAWLSVTTLRDRKVVVLPATIEARSGTHSHEGSDPLVPPYPNARSEPR